MPAVIRHAEPADIAAIKAIYDQPSVYANTLQLPYQPVSNWQRLYNADSDFYNLVAEVEGKVVGQLGLQVCPRPRRRHVAELGMGVSEHYQGQGIGSALLRSALELCDNWLNIRRVELTVYVNNEAAIALYERFGFEAEAELTDYAFQYGGYVNALSMARITSRDS
ncbi:MAG: GNAT family N-acetyltransferase [Gammaproteobacteria bacterium]|nr:GNAT family N-acetyltransferase [Gammaproteobacteria bacterium]MBU1554033.1 GNAT family N-acetyltransferase [Gammaproteobacteria bacterium]MBU2072601.1 GNAT family N-acetyltransferase [Gammaproteobacteria bacterium]MBU2182265.1 GNAT family N-acetyltransferase [Gammaproteobacteria bacterium]MBU2207155.1 GNAT family N-acetyltransferase [Gammaproteobacteria bacterium]